MRSSSSQLHLVQPGFYKSILSRAALCLTLAMGALVMPPATAAPTDCEGHYYGDQRPDLNNLKLGVSAKELCSDYFAIWYSGVARSPLWSAEFLSRGRIEAGRGVDRSNDFRPDTRLPKDWRSELNDYRGSGFDRGHLAPSADMPTPGSDSQSFLLSNMIPQDPALNRGLWAAIESAVRAQANYKPIYVITGAIFHGQSINRLNGRVLIPTHVYKLIYDPERNMAGAYLVENAPNKRHRELTLSELEQFAGVSFLPAAQGVKKLKLPRPRY